MLQCKKRADTNNKIYSASINNYYFSFIYVQYSFIMKFRLLYVGFTKCNPLKAKNLIYHYLVGVMVTVSTREILYDVSAV